MKSKTKSYGIVLVDSDYEREGRDISFREGDIVVGPLRVFSDYSFLEVWTSEKDSLCAITMHVGETVRLLSPLELLALEAE